MQGSCLITGGARSGKSSYALGLASDAARPHFIATAWADDAEMALRVKRHRAERGSQWTTIETRLDLGPAISSACASGAGFIVVDCLTLWTSNILIEDASSLECRLSELLKALEQPLPPLAFVTNEVGCGIVPGDSLSREFRDAAGRVNRVVASAVDSVFLMVCGIPMKIK